MCHDHLQQDGLTLTRDMTGDGPQGGSSELLRAVSISFSAGARAAWRTHPLSQTLFIVGGRDHLRQEKKGKLTSGLPELPRQRGLSAGTLGLWRSDSIVIYHRTSRAPSPGNPCSRQHFVPDKSPVAPGLICHLVATP